MMRQEQHKRLTEKLLAYWESLRGSRPFPQERDIEPSALSDIWDSCFLVKNMLHHGGGETYRYDYLGKALFDAFGSDVTHKEISATLIDPASPPLMRGFRSVIRDAKPVEEQAEFTNSQGMLVKYRCCMLPLGDSTPGVAYILGGMKWKSF